MTQDEIFNKVASTLVDALGVDEDEVTREASLQEDLGAESIDFLDIVFRLEKNFAIKIPRGDLFPDEKLFSDERFVKSGRFTPEGLNELAARIPFADVSKLRENPELSSLAKLYTVEMVVKYIESKV